MEANTNHPRHKELERQLNECWWQQMLKNNPKLQEILDAISSAGTSEDT